MSLCFLLSVACSVSMPALAQETGDDAVYPPRPDGRPPPLEVAGATAAGEADMQPYDEVIPGSDVSFTMLPVPGGKYRRGSPESEPGRSPDEGPQHELEIAPFWMGRCEVTWNEYHVFMFKLDQELRKAGKVEPTAQDAWADAVSRPTPPYVPMDFEMGEDGYPAICMTQFAARQYTEWLSMKTGRFYRLPSEAEWEYACRAGTTTAYSFGDDLELLDEHAWYFDNADDRYHQVRTRKPNPWGLHDMHGNVCEWVIDQHLADAYAQYRETGAVNPIAWPTDLYPRVVRGGSWDDDPARLRSAARRGSQKGWKVQDPQLPKSIWYHTDAMWLGFRVVRPLTEPPEEIQRKFWDADLESIREIQERQRAGGR